MRWCIVIGSFLLAYASAQAQVNTERLRPTERQGFGGMFGGELDVRRGNAALFEATLNARFDYRKDAHLIFWVGTLRYGERRGRTFRNSAFFHTRYNYDVTPRCTWEAFGQLERDGFTLLQLRSLIGSGLRIGYMHTPALRIHQASALMFEYEVLDLTRVARHPVRVRALRWSNYLTLRLRLGEQLALLSVTYLQPRLEAFRDVRLLHESSFETRLSPHVAFSTTFTYRYDSDPPDAVLPYDAALRTGLRLTW